MARNLSSEREWNSFASHHPPRTLMLGWHEIGLETKPLGSLVFVRLSGACC